MVKGKKTPKPYWPSVVIEKATFGFWTSMPPLVIIGYGWWIWWIWHDELKLTKLHWGLLLGITVVCIIEFYAICYDGKTRVWTNCVVWIITLMALAHVLFQVDIPFV